MTEYNLHLAICNYLKLQYPNVLFFSDLSGVKLPKGLAVKVAKLKSRRGIPDLFILAPRRGYHALCLELKKEGEVLYKKNGEFKNEHLQEQSEVLNELNQLGYRALFAVGFEQAKNIIDDYLT